MTDKVVVKSRAYKVEDKEAVLKVFTSNIGIYFAEEEAADFEAFLDSQALDNQYLVFYSDNNPESFLACGGNGFIEDKMFLRWGMVEQGVHKRGTGTELLIQRLNAVRTTIGEVDVYIDTSQHVQGFYEKFGFVAVSSERDGFALNIDKVRMVCSSWQQDFVKPAT